MKLNLGKEYDCIKRGMQIMILFTFKLTDDDQHLPDCLQKGVADLILKVMAKDATKTSCDIRILVISTISFLSGCILDHKTRHKLSKGIQA